MILNETGQTYRFGEKTFTIGGTVIDIRYDTPTLLGTVLALRVEEGAVLTAQYDFEDDGTQCVPLEALVPACSSVPEETGRLYALSYLFDGSSGERADVLAVSSDRSVLVRKMLEDVETDPSISVVLTSAGENKEADTLGFNYESADEFDDSLYLSYTIQPVPVYPAYGSEVDP